LVAPNNAQIGGPTTPNAHPHLGLGGAETTPGAPGTFLSFRAILRRRAQRIIRPAMVSVRSCIACAFPVPHRAGDLSWWSCLCRRW